MKPGLLIACALFLGACSAGLTEVELALARTKWQAAQLRSYSVTYVRTCECANSGMPLKTDVEQNMVVAVNDRKVGPGEKIEGAITIDELFSLIETSLQSKAEVQASFDGDRGYPTRIALRQADRHDGNATVEIVAFTPR